VLNDIIELFDYSRWANRRILSAASALPAEQLGRDMGSSFPSVLATLAHILSAQWIWLERFLGRSPTRAPEGWDLSTTDALAATWAEVERVEREYLGTLTEDDLRRVIHFRTLKGDPAAGPLGQLFRHVVNHSTYHRGQVVTMLRQLGHSAPSTDLVLYYREHAPPMDAPPVTAS
jgi:uncharacterized damage-inducible protein DinB